jgi:hypothetical protein
MFRFTIRDVLWLMVVVALGCALATSWQQTAAQRQQAKGWRTRAGALEAVLKDAGWKIRWEEEWIRLRPPDVIGRNGHIATIRTDSYEPSPLATTGYDWDFH